MEEFRYRVRHFLVAAGTGFASILSGGFGILAVRQVIVSDFADEVPILLFGLLMLGVSVFQLICFSFALFGSYRVILDEWNLRIVIGIGRCTRTWNFETDAIREILVADNGRGRPCVGILAEKVFRFGSLLPLRSIEEMVGRLQEAVVRTGSSQPGNTGSMTPVQSAPVISSMRSEKSSSVSS